MKTGSELKTIVVEIINVLATHGVTKSEMDKVFRHARKVMDDREIKLMQPMEADKNLVLKQLEQSAERMRKRDCCDCEDCF